MNTIQKLATNTVLLTTTISVWQPPHARKAKYLLRNSEYRKLVSVSQLARRFYSQFTMPWNGGLRLITRAGVGLCHDAIYDFHMRLRSAGSDYEQMLETAKPESRMRRELMDLTSECTDGRSLRHLHIVESCGISMTMLPFPEAGDWRLSLPKHDDAMALDITTDIERYYVRLCLEFYDRLNHHIDWLIRQLERATWAPASVIARFRHVCVTIRDLDVDDPILLEQAKKLLDMLEIPPSEFLMDTRLRQQMQLKYEDVKTVLRLGRNQVADL